MPVGVERVLFGLMAGYALWCCAIYFVQDGVIFPGAGGLAPDPHVANRAQASPVWITAEDGARIEAWFIPGEGCSAGNPGPAVVYAHGNGELIDYWPDALQPYRRWGVSVLLPEYRGYGRSQGIPSQIAIASDMERFVAWLAARAEVDPARIVYHGRSLGGGVVAALAARRKPAALVLESTFTSIASFFPRFLVPPVLCRHPFRTDAVLPGLDCPMLIVHGSRDEVVPVSHARRLHELVPAAQYLEMDAGHNDFPSDERGYWTAIRSFLLVAGVLDGGNGSGPRLRSEAAGTSIAGNAR